MKNEKRKERLIEQFGIVEEESIVSLTDLEEREEIDICQVLSISSWNIEEN